MSAFLQRRTIQDAYVRVIALDHVEAFCSHPHLRLDREDFPSDRLALPGYIGPRYRVGGLLFVGMNPGNGAASEGLSPELVTQERVLRELLAGQTTLVDAMRVMHATKARWRYWRNVVMPAAKAAGFELDQVAHLNLFPFRTVDQKLPVGLIQHFRPMFDALHEALAPSMLVACGVSTGNKLRRSGLVPDVVLPRTRGDRGEAPGYAEALQQIAATMALPSTT